MSAEEIISPAPNMPNLRYAIAALFFAASVGCLGLWGWSMSRLNTEQRWMYDLPSRTIAFGISRGEAAVSWPKRAAASPARDSVQFRVNELLPNIVAIIEKERNEKGQFGSSAFGVYFPIWYASLIFSLAGVGVLRFRRQFSIRSALIGLAVVAALIGMAVIL